MKRFWKNVTAEQVDGGYAVRLDARAMKTPLKKDLLLPNAAMADAVKLEWDAVAEKIDPAAMPVTGLANAAIDRVAPERQTFVDTIAAYGETDLFCYRAEAPDALAARQEAAWGKWLRWAQARYFLSFNVVTGIMHQPQPIPTVVRLKEAVAEMSDWQLAAASRLTHISGSLVAVLILLEGEADAGALWPDLILDELWQEEQWGADEYALKNRRDRQVDFKAAANFLAMVT